MAAENKNLVGRLKDLTQCCICADTFTDARVLPCLHTFCLQCLQLAGADRRSHFRMPCPLCRKEFAVPREGFSLLPKNFLMENLLEMTSLPDPVVTEDTSGFDASVMTPCDVCLDAGPSEATADASISAASTAAAVVYCVDCRLNLCRLCYNHHKRVPASKNHRFSDDPAVVEKFRQEIAGQITAVTVWMAEGETKKRRLVEAKTKYSDDAKKVEEDIGKLRDEAKRMIDSKANSLLKELSEGNGRHLSRYQNDLDRLECHLAILESFMKRCSHTKDTETGELVSRISEDLNSTAEDLHLIHRSHLAEQVVEVEVPIKTTNLNEFLDQKKEKKKLVKCEGRNADKAETASEAGDASSISPGDVEEHNGRNMSRTAVFILIVSILLAVYLNCFVPKTGRLLSVQLTTRLGEGKGHSVMGVTSLGQHVYVLSRSLKSVLVYEALDPFRLLKEIPIAEVKSPRDVAGSPVSDSLYISDEDSSCIWKVPVHEVHVTDGWFSSDRYEHRVSRWLNVITKPYTISVTDNGDILILRSGTPYRLEIYGPDAVLLQSIELPLDIEDPWHAVQSPSGSFIVSYGWSGTLKQGIAELDSDGKILRTYDPVYDWNRLKNPQHLAVDGENRVFVADFYNNRVLILDSNFNWDQKTILTGEKDDVLKPYRLCLNRVNGQLIVAHYDGDTVDVYTLKDDS